MKIVLLSIILLLSCAKKEEVSSGRYIKEVSDSCKNSLTTKVIIDDLEWTDFTDARNIDQARNAKTVGMIYVPFKKSRCTGFIINKNMVMTNNHCVNNLSNSKGVVFKIRDKVGDVKTYECGKLVTTNIKLDYTVLKCKSDLGSVHGVSLLSTEEVRKYQNIYVIQENCDYKTDPNCEIQKVIGEGEIVEIASYKIGHNADTLGGSSGSPIYSDHTNSVVAIHNAGRKESQYQDARNFGKPMNKIMKQLKLKKIKFQTKREKEVDLSC